ncbi:GNAT family N-acetyltransferase [Bacillus sp. SG-1]|uniref:GNAT family N-acetyltransferase n=1 Tax=Bacillus sp. SG-1 TaxID=161544 RepID=UPI0001543206|nr:GNAT family N-acetyltransferase [Bacillus sp. SG-1]EDL66272.1 YvbK [Bacillus sp. SG-1]
MKLLLSPVRLENRRDYLPLLLIADESEDAVNSYIDEGEMFSIHYNDHMAGVILFTPVNKGTLELKNFAIVPEFRGKGLGKAAINEALSLYKKRNVKQIIVGTANSSIDNIAFYQKAGFRMNEIKRDFFSEYTEPIYENGIRALDMVMFEKKLI